eukprot:NODE_7360_length_572_cov_50.456979_g6348_i0.p1 GENE.NODE_7360_length_572_cov_50.456979_g6348_i0~~NODE_7360_length_572_cov_50.456979_g6348_i0.p1  ORF type:complete len:121 (+),score=22.06 NODE_7360_length_572_cov_50.456979_g6348_i0:99-461(+)
MCDDNGGQGCFVCALCSDRIRGAKAAKNRLLQEKDRVLVEKDQIIAQLQAELHEERRANRRQRLQLNDVLGIVGPGALAGADQPVQPSMYHGATAYPSSYQGGPAAGPAMSPFDRERYGY